MIAYDFGEKVVNLRLGKKSYHTKPGPRSIICLLKTTKDTWPLQN